MSNKEKEIIPNNLLYIREELGYSQKEMGEILKVSDRMIYYYETEQHNLPIDKAIFISRKWNYDLNWIYKQNKPIIVLPDGEKPNFYVDIRHFFRVGRKKIHFSIPNYFYKYINDVKEIQKSTDSDEEKKRSIAQLNGRYKANDDNIYFEASIKIKKFISKIHFGKKKCTYATNESTVYLKPTKEQREEAMNFLTELLNTH